MTTHWTLGCDAHDPHRLARFWAQALGYVPEPGYDFPDGASIVDPDAVLPAMGWLRVREPKTAKNRVHIDIRVGGKRPIPTIELHQLIQVTVAQLVELGATVAHQTTDDGLLEGVTMLDPEGNEFCVA